ncbi:MAG: 4-oxalocrotonate tautomerase [Methanomicrobiales archaeon]|nr:4-oxalocrotonate tautomerase [Methanomicrobiales archaeon]
MPVISIEMGPANSEVKEQLIKTLTKDAAKITKIPEQSFIVLVKEYPIDGIGVGGQPLSQRR